MLKLKGKFDLEVIHKDGSVEHHVLSNTVVTVGKNMILDVMFNEGTASTNWYFGLIDNDSFSAIAAEDEMDSHAGWVEFEDYDEANRQEWLADAAADGSVTNSTQATFTISDSGVLKGFFIADDDTIGGSTGTLWSAAAFTSTVTVSDGDTIKLTYTLSC